MPKLIHGSQGEGDMEPPLAMTSVGQSIPVTLTLKS